MQKGPPANMQIDPQYDDVVAEVRHFSATVSARCALPVAAERIVVDPVLAGKTLEHNLELLRSLNRFGTCGALVLAGISRKLMLGRNAAAAS
jgi:dihydropteroate synthase